MLRAALTLGFFGFLKVREFTVKYRTLTLGSTLPGGGMHFFIKRSKTDQMGKGTTICIVCTKGRHTCPVAAMEAYRGCCRCSTHSSPTSEMKGHSHPRASTPPSYPWWINAAMIQPNTTPTVHVLVQPQQHQSGPSH